MLVMFRFKNYGPFKDEVMFDMRAVKAYKEHSNHLVSECDGNSLLKVAAIYGANASGKSNFVSAYNAFSNIVAASFNRNDKSENSASFLEEKFWPYLFDKEGKDNGTEFEAIYHYEGNEYQYGFVYDSTRIEYEWFYKKSLKTNRVTKIMERTPDEIELGYSVKKTCEKYISDIDDSVLALSFFSSLKLRTHVFKEMVRCILNILSIPLAYDVLCESIYKGYFAKDFDGDEKASLLKFLNAIDVGIKDIEVKKNKDQVQINTYHLGRDNEMYSVPFEIESDGTKKSIALYSLVRIATLKGKGLIIDEFNSRLHPLLQKYIIDLFYQEGSQGQLIYTTHDTSLLDKQFMRRDQIWFTSKNEYGESSLYSLAEFKIRNDKAFGKDYLGGVYGGIPLLKDFSFEEDTNEKG